jgi:hypothetical protein
MKQATEMTTQDLIKAARNYNNVMNEGGDGYNPYDEEMERRAHEAATKAATKHAATPQGRIDALHRRIELECGSVAREWGNTAEIEALQSSLYAEINKIKAEIDAEFLQTWTIETTKARRIEWNNFANTELKPLGSGPAMMRRFAEKQKIQGWTMEDLRKAVKAHNL